MKDIELLQRMINESHYIVFFGGAGTSTDSGIKDFRSKDGIYQLKSKYPPEKMLSSAMFYHDPEEFYEFYRTNMNSTSAVPNTLHFYLKKLEDSGKLKAIITQNIDGLHQKAGSSHVYEIHGTIYQNHCTKCHKFYDVDVVFSSSQVPYCHCGGVIKPDVVLYGEMLPSDMFEKAVEEISKADLLIVAGTSLLVQPACSLISLFHGKYLVILNQEKTPYDSEANLVIHGNLKDIFEKLSIPFDDKKEE